MSLTKAVKSKQLTSKHKLRADKKRADPNMSWLKPGLVGRVKFLAGSTGLRHATVTSFWLET